MIKFVKGAVAELKLVQWPSKNEATRLTGYVIGASLLLGIFVMAVDFAINKVVSLYL